MHGAKKMFTYKKHRHTGKFSAFEAEVHDIELKARKIGDIAEAAHFSQERGYRISFAVKKAPTQEQPAPFKWVNVKTRFTSVADAKAFLVEHFEELIKELDLYSFPKD